MTDTDPNIATPREALDCPEEDIGEAHARGRLALSALASTLADKSSKLDFALAELMRVSHAAEKAAHNARAVLKAESDKRAAAWAELEEKQKRIDTLTAYLQSQDADGHDPEKTPSR